MKLKKQMAPIQINFKETGFSFKMGEPIKPGWEELRVILKFLWSTGRSASFLPYNVPEEILVAGTKQQVETLVPVILQRMENQAIRGMVDFENEPRMLTIAYILAWYWHIHLGGPKPEFSGARTYMRKPNFGPVPELACPFCGHRYDVPVNLVHQSAIFKAWHKWLAVHFKEYHMWDDSTKSKKARKLVSK